MQEILVLEDDRELAEGIEMALISDDLSFTLCGTVMEAKKMQREKRFDLLILDINLPDGSGLELCREIRRGSKVPIMLLTARDMELDIVKGLECGADDYITKPFSLMVLRARIGRCFAAVQAGSKQEYVKEPFRFCFETMEFYKDHIPVELSRTEQRILYLLVTNAGRILTRERLMEWVLAGGNGIRGRQCPVRWNPASEGQTGG